MARYNRLLEMPRDDFFSLETSTTLQLHFFMAWLERLTAIVTVRMLGGRLTPFFFVAPLCFWSASLGSADCNLS